jgi:DNA modification methylase
MIWNNLEIPDNPYYSDDDVVIYHGDCREILPNLPKVDLVLTDPPYGIGEARGKNKSRWQLAKPKDYGISDWDDRPVELKLLHLIMAKAKNTIIFGGNFYYLPPSSCWIVWDKDNSGDFADCELAWTNFSSAVRKYTWRWNGMLQEPKNPKDYRWHPTQKPTGLISLIISDYSKENETILDPFLGSGTTAYCAKKLNRKCIGIEIKEKYCEIAAKRCLQGVFDLR